jgi:DNA-binding transcriptional MerR regulator
MTGNASTQEWPIREVARATGLTSRALRHYEQIGLLAPSRVANNGYRFYGEAELSRLYRILSLRELELPLSTIQIALDDDTTLAEAIASHLVLLEERRDRTSHQIAVVRRALDEVEKGQTMTIRDVFAGVDPTQYEAEVRERWGDEAWERSAKRRAQMSADQRRADDDRSLDITVALRDAAASGDEPASASFQALVAAHHRWVAEMWGGRVPDRVAYSGLSEMYVADERFAATYGGQRNAEVIREAMQVWIAANLE